MDIVSENKDQAKLVNDISSGPNVKERKFRGSFITYLHNKALQDFPGKPKKTAAEEPCDLERPISQVRNSTKVKLKPSKQYGPFHDDYISKLSNEYIPDNNLKQSIKLIPNKIFPKKRDHAGSDEQNRSDDFNRNLQRLKHLPDDKGNFMKAGLMSTQLNCQAQTIETTLPSKESPRESPNKAGELPLADSDDEEVAAGTNPFAQDQNSSQAQTQAGQEEEHIEKADAEELMASYIRRLELHSAVPESCLTDAVFKVDRPKDAMTLDRELPPLRLQDHCQEQDILLISVTEAYSPFQFWFNFGHHIPTLLNELNENMNIFYSRDCGSGYKSCMPRYFLRKGLICVANYEFGWRRAMIVETPASYTRSVSIYYVDYGCGAEVSHRNLRFLPDFFGYVPALAARGTLSHIHPLGRHWPPETTAQFRNLVLGRQVYAHVVEWDLTEGILFLRLSHDKHFSPSLNRLLVDADLAGKSEHFIPKVIDMNCGKRVRYLREMLPSFTMLESRVYPMQDEEFEDEFDAIIYGPLFHREYQVPQLKNPFYKALLDALTAWMPGYKRRQDLWMPKFRGETETEGGARPVRQGMAQFSENKSEFYRAWKAGSKGRRGKGRGEKDGAGPPPPPHRTSPKPTSSG